MKKILATIAVFSLAAVTAVGFTACGGDNGGVDYTVTEAEWKAVLKTIIDCDTSIKCKYTEKSDYGEGDFTFEYDKTNKAICYSGLYEEIETVTYAWVDGDKAYNTDDENETRHVLEDFEEEVENAFTYYAGGYMINYGNITEKYGDFTYDDTSKEYVATFEIEEYQVSYKLKFENKKLVKLYAGQSGEEYTCEYTYDVTVVVPDEIKSLPLSE